MFQHVAHSFKNLRCSFALFSKYGKGARGTRMLLPNAGKKIADWLLRGFIQCANIQVLIARSITASVHGGCGYDDDLYWTLYSYYVVVA